MNREEYLKNYNEKRQKRYETDMEYREREKTRLREYYQQNKERLRIQRIKKKLLKMYEEEDLKN